MKFLKYLLILFLLLIIFFFGKGLLTPEISYENEITVNKPIEEAWAVMSDEATLPDWIEGFKKTEHVSGTPNTVGAVSKVYIDEGGKEMTMEETITALKPNEHMAMTFTMDFMNMDYDLYMKEIDGKTYIKTKSKTTGNGMVAKSIISFMPKAMKTQEDKNLNKLKVLIENNTKDYFPRHNLDPIQEVTN